MVFCVWVREVGLWLDYEYFDWIGFVGIFIWFVEMVIFVRIVVSYYGIVCEWFWWVNDLGVWEWFLVE